MQLSHSDLFLKFSFGKQPLSGIQNSKNYTFFKNESQFKTFICFPHEFSSLLKFSEEATEFEKISHLFWNLLSDVKKSGRFFQIFVQNFKVQKLCWFLLFFWQFSFVGGLFGLSRKFPIGIFNFCSLCCAAAAGTYTFFFSWESLWNLASYCT